MSPDPADGNGHGTKPPLPPPAPHDPLDLRFEQQAYGILVGLHNVLNHDPSQPEVGFVLLIFPTGQTEGRCNYIADGLDRAAVAALLRRQADAFDQFKEIDT